MYGYRCHVCPAALDEGDAGPVQMLRHIEWHQELCATLRPGKGIVEGCNVRCVRHDGVFRQGESLDFIHAIGALLIDAMSQAIRYVWSPFAVMRKGSTRRSRGRASSIERYEIRQRTPS